MKKNKDYYLVTVIGFLVGWLILLPANNVDLIKISPLVIVISVLGFSILAPIALFVLKYLSRFWKPLEQFSKFAAVGTLNTLIDLGVLNLLIFLTDISSGTYYSLFKGISFLFGTTNSYFWNKFWTFQSNLPVTMKEYARFIFFTIIGTLINVSIASVVVNVIGAPEGVNPKLWANVGALVGVFAALMWNFLSYKKIVFKNQNKNTDNPGNVSVEL